MLMTTPPPDVPGHAGWLDTLRGVGAATRAHVAVTVDAHAGQLSVLFYDAMLADPSTHHLLDHQLVNRRLHASMARWVRHLFAVDAELADLVQVQQHTGAVHARIGVPSEMVRRGARALKRGITRALVEVGTPRDQLVEAIPYVHEQVDLAVGVMEMAYARDADRMARADEAYRLFFLSQNMKAERERQKSQLLEWAQQILVRYYWEAPSEAGDAALAQGFSHSQFGLWLQHKASILFDDAAEIARIRQHTDAIEQELLPQLSQARARHDDARALVAEINRHIDSIKSLLGSMFDRYSEAEDGRDGVTHLLNRRYLPSVAQREIALAQAQGSSFAMLVVDIDGFKPLRDSLGLDPADMVLQQVGAALVDHVRAGDFVFRIGDDQFLVLVVDAPVEAVRPLADALRERVASTRLRTLGHASTHVTVSIGAALFDGHPDFQRLLDRATEAMREAKAQGRNRCVLAA